MNKTFDKFLVLLGVIGVLVVVMAIVAMATRPASVVAADSPSTEASGETTAPEETEPTVAHLTLGEWAITGTLTIPPGPVTFEIHNEGTVTHNVEIDGVGTSPDVSSGDIETWAIAELPAGTYEVICAIPGHKEAGMRATLTVAEGAEPAAEAGGHGAGEDVDWGALDEAMMQSIMAFPAATEGMGNALLEPEIVDGVKVYELTTAITPWEVEAGRFVDAWTYNGIVPGPMIQVEVGDTVRVILHNELPAGTEIHWHGVRTPNLMDGVAPLTQPLVKPGESFTYEFVAERRAVGMYHAHTHGHVAVPNGLFGVILIGDMPIPAGRTIGGLEVPADIEIAQEIPMVLNDAGVIGFSLNGKSFPATQPYVVNTGDWLMVHYYNEGLQSHPMHQHQFPQLVIAKDGIPLEEPYWADTINVAPGERYTAIMHADDPGVWVWHCHILNHVEREEGMFGMVTALIVEDSA